MKKFYIKERFNPQFPKPYYRGMGQMTAKEANEYKNPLYGDNVMHAYDTQAEYDKALAKFQSSKK